MTKSVLSRSPSLWFGVLSLVAAGWPAAALAQGTAEQREACSADAIRLCPDAIPDVDQTTACMKAHEAQLSRRCHRVFSAEVRQPSAGARGDARREPADGFDRPRRGYGAPADEDYPSPRRAERQPVGPDGDYYEGPRQAERFRYGPDDDAGPQRVERAPYGPDEDDGVRRAERLPPGPGYDGDGYGPRRYLYLTPRGRAVETPDDAY